MQNSETQNRKEVSSKNLKKVLSKQSHKKEYIATNSLSGLTMEDCKLELSKEEIQRNQTKCRSYHNFQGNQSSFLLEAI